MAEDYSKVAKGSYCEVWLHKDAIKVLKKAPAKDRARVGEILNHLSERGEEDLHELQFKREGRFKAGHKQVAVYAVKSYQLRLIGGWSEQGPRRLICPEAAIKKQNKADQDQLNRVATKVGKYRGD